MKLKPLTTLQQFDSNKNEDKQEKNTSSECLMKNHSQYKLVMRIKYKTPNLLMYF